MLNFLREKPLLRVFVLLVIASLVYFGIAYTVADTGFPGGISEQARLLIFADVILIMSVGAWYAIWYKGDAAPTASRRGDRQVPLIVIAITLAGVGVWMLVQVLANGPVIAIQ